MIYQVVQTARFSAWLVSLRDAQGRAKIARRVDRIKRGNFGDHRAVGGGVSEMRIHEGPGYRVYFVVRRATCVILLCGGDKSSQRRDIDQAVEMAGEI